MRIMFVSSGKSIHTIKWVNSLVLKGHEVWLVSNCNHRNESDEIDKKVTQIYLRFGGNLGYYLNAMELRKYYNRIKPEVINAHYASGYGTLLRVSGLAKIAILSVWGSDIYEFPYRNRLCGYILKRNLREAKHIAATSYNMKNQVMDLIGNKNISITPFGIDLEKFNSDLRKENDDIIIGTIKTLEPNYRVDYLIKAISMLIEELKLEDESMAKRIKVEIYGDGSQKIELAKQIAQSGLSSIVQLKGKILHDEVPEKLAKMDIFVALSEKESFGVAVLEACALGVPVVVSDALGFLEIIDNENTGFIVKDGNPKEVSKIIKRLIYDENLRKVIGNNGQKMVKDQYSWEKSVQIMEDVYREYGLS